MLVLNKEELADCKDMFTNAQAQMRFGTLRATINSLHLDLVSVAALTAILGEVSSTNHDPSLLAGYYMACVGQLSGCPRMVWADCGTENGILAALHQVFHNDANNQQMYGHRYVASTSNQRIEAWLSNFRKSCSEWWIGLFKDLTASGAFLPGNLIQTYCIRYCFMDILQKELDFVATTWNEHLKEGGPCLNVQVESLMSSFSSQKTQVQYLVGFTSLLQSELHDFFSHISDFLRYKFVITSPV